MHHIKETLYDSCAKDGHTPLLVAVQEGHVTLAKFLLTNGASPIVITKKTGNTALHIASFDGHLDMIKLLLENEAIDINRRRNYGYSAIHIALSGGQFLAAHLLMEDPRWDKRLYDRRLLKWNAALQLYKWHRQQIRNMQSLYSANNREFDCSALDVSESEDSSLETVPAPGRNLNESNSAGHQRPSIQLQIDVMQEQIEQFSLFQEQRLDLQNRVSKLEKENQTMKAKQNDISNRLSKVCNDMVRIKKDSSNYQQAMERPFALLKDICTTLMRGKDFISV